jgi:hypothetical protein
MPFSYGHSISGDERSSRNLKPSNDAAEYDIVGGNNVS